MTERDRTDYITAFAIGTALGVGAALLFKPRRSRAKRVLKRVEPYRRKAAKRAKRASRAVGAGIDATSERSGAFVEAGREILERFRDELVDMAGNARTELDDMISDQLEDARKSLKRTTERVRT
ncbi:MAG: hypothetical protein ACRELV_15600 [Longimicrobiales bacterium]